MAAKKSSSIITKGKTTPGEQRKYPAKKPGVSGDTPKPRKALAGKKKK